MLREGPEQVWSHFPFAPVSSHPCGRNNLRRHDKQLQSHRQENFLEITAHSILGLADIYNLLPQRIVNNTCVHKFQRELQDLMKETATDRNLDWECMYSPRIPLHLHPLRRFLEAQEWETMEVESLDEACEHNLVQKTNALPSWLRK